MSDAHVPLDRDTIYREMAERLERDYVRFRPEHLLLYVDMKISMTRDTSRPEPMPATPRRYRFTRKKEPGAAITRSTLNHWVAVYRRKHLGE